MTQLGFGCANLATLDAGAGGRGSIELVRTAHDAGVRFFDTADAYGDGMSEQVLGRAFRRESKDVTVATKVGWCYSERPRFERLARRALRPVSQRIRPMLNRVAETTRGPVFADKDFSVPYLDTALDASLRRLGGLPIEVYQLHEPGAVHPEPIAEWAQSAIDSGRFQRFGVCLRGDSDPTKWLKYPQVEVAQIPFGLLDWKAGHRQASVVGQHEAELIVHGALGEGLLTGRPTLDELRERTPQWRAISELDDLARSIGTTLPQLAIWFVRDAVPAATCLVGMSSVRHVRASVDFFESELPGPEVFERIRQLFSADEEQNPTEPR